MVSHSTGDIALEVTSAITTLIPWLGGPLSAVLSGMVTERKINRVKRTLAELAEDLKDFKSEVSEQYVKTEEFEELLDAALIKIANERNEDKRSTIKSFLEGVIRKPQAGYDEQRRFLRLLDDIDPAELTVLKEIAQRPNTMVSGIGSPIGTLIKRTNMPESQIEAAIDHLNTMHLTKLQSLRITMTASGAENLTHAITALGWRLLEYLGSAE
jgi:hypothetical protein